MMHSYRGSLLLMLSSLFLFGACAIFGPSGMYGRYDVIEANGNPVPTFVNADGSQEFGVRLKRGKLTIRELGDLDIILEFDIVDQLGNVAEMFVDTLDASFVENTGTLTLTRTDSSTPPLWIMLSNSAAINQDGTIAIATKRPLSPTGGFLVTYDIPLLFDR